MTRDEYREQWLKWKDAYEIQAFRIFNKALKDMIDRIPFDNITYDNYEYVIALNIHEDYIKKALDEVYYKIGLIHGQRVGAGINRDIKKFKKDLFSEKFYDKTVKYLRLFGGKKIRAISTTLKKKVVKVVETSMNSGIDVDRMQKELIKQVKSPKFTKYEAMRIARTETTAAANYAAWLAAEDSGILMEKYWIATKDDRVRQNGLENPKKDSHWSHKKQDGVMVGHSEKFEMHSDDGRTNYMNYPGDPEGDADNIINCRCAVAYKPIRGENGRPILR